MEPRLPPQWQPGGPAKLSSSHYLGAGVKWTSGEKQRYKRWTLRTKVQVEFHTFGCCCLMCFYFLLAVLVQCINKGEKNWGSFATWYTNEVLCHTFFILRKVAEKRHVTQQNYHYFFTYKTLSKYHCEAFLHHSHFLWILYHHRVAWRNSPGILNVLVAQFWQSPHVSICERLEKSFCIFTHWWSQELRMWLSTCDGKLAPSSHWNYWLHLIDYTNDGSWSHSIPFVLHLKSCSTSSRDVGHWALWGGAGTRREPETGSAGTGVKQMPGINQSGWHGASHRVTSRGVPIGCELIKTYERGSRSDRSRCQGEKHRVSGEKWRVWRLHQEVCALGQVHLSRAADI